MISFESDYTLGAHPLILECLIKTNMDVHPGYGLDPLCESAKRRIREACGTPDADVFLLSGGTQTNRLTVSALLRPYEGVIAAETGHIEVHEAGAIESTGHKVLTLPSHEGKICPKELEGYLERFYADETHEHMVFPGMVYISHPTEMGTLYTKSELAELHSVCARYSIPLYADGARLAYGLESRASDMDLKAFASTVDAFYIGGTKVGALIGEALVFPRGNAPAHLFTMVKRSGAMLAKGRVIGAQFEALFTNGLYFELGRNAADKAEKLKTLFKEKGYSFYIDSPTNQQFFVMDDETIKRLGEKVCFGIWERLDEYRCVVRFVTSWATTDADIDELASIL